MRDTAIVAEILYAYFNGLRTTKAQQLNGLYNGFEKRDEFDEGGRLGADIEAALNFRGVRLVHLKPNHESVSSVATCARYHARAQGNPGAERGRGRGGSGLRTEGEIRAENLGDLIEALESDDVTDEGGEVDDESVATEGAAAPGGDEGELSATETRLDPYKHFVAASHEKTNTADTRKVRFSAFMSAVARRTSTSAQSTGPSNDGRSTSSTSLLRLHG